MNEREKKEMSDFEALNTTENQNEDTQMELDFSRHNSGAKNKQEVSFEEALEILGGCGLYQILHSIAIVAGMVAGTFILYSMYYFELP